MKLKLLVPAIFLITLLVTGSCQRNHTESIRLMESYDSLIVLVNINHWDRKELAGLIHVVNVCNPRVLGLNVVFPELGDPEADSLLAESLKEKSVVLVEGINNNKRLKTHSYFDPLYGTQRIGSGMLRFAADENIIVTDSYFMFEDNDGQEVSFAYLLAFNYDGATASNFRRKIFFIPNKPFEIKFTRSKDQYFIFEREDLGKPEVCDFIKGKIVIMGYLGPGNEDSYKTPLTVAGYDSGTYSTVIVANIVSEILEYANE